jgi:hypothetical protein
MMSFLSRLFQPIQLHADHGPESLRDPEEAITSTATPPALRVVGGGWFEAAPGGPVKVVTIKTTRTQTMVRGRARGLVWHWTATKHGTGRTCCDHIQKLPVGDERSASFGGCIESDGTYYQTAPIERGTWHAGGATARRFVEVAGVWGLAPTASHNALSANSLFHGTELVNVGEVRYVGGKWLGWPFVGNAPVVPESEVFDDGGGTPLKVDERGHFGSARGKYYHAYTNEQVRTAQEVVLAFHLACPDVGRDACAWTHAVIDPTRKTDPGPLWSHLHLPAILDDVFGKVG